MSDYKFEVTCVARDEDGYNVAKATVEFDDYLDALSVLQVLHDEIERNRGV